MTSRVKVPEALNAPSLCPRCDQPAELNDQCSNCSLQLRRCGACNGVSGPYDRFCGFCSHELALGPRRSFVWKLWLVVALVPLLLGLTYGIVWAGVPAAKSVGQQAVARVSNPPPSPAGVRPLRSKQLKFEYVPPRDWVVYDYTHVDDPTAAQPFVIASRNQTDNDQASLARGDLITQMPGSTVMVLQRSHLDKSDDTAASMLQRQVDQLTAQPPDGATVTMSGGLTTTTVGGRPAATVVLRVTRSDSAFYLQRAYIEPGDGSGQVFKVEAMSPAAAWQGQDARAVDASIHSIRLFS